MKTVVKPASRMTIEQFAEKHDLTMELTERNEFTQLPRWIASFAGAETKDGAILRGEYGSGSTPEEAISDYAKRITNKLLVIDAYGVTRREIYVNCDFT